jgi:hypothetical protein
MGLTSISKVTKGSIELDPTTFEEFEVEVTGVLSDEEQRQLLLLLTRLLGLGDR